MKKLILGLLITLTFASCKENTEPVNDTEVEVEIASVESDSQEPSSTLEFDNAETALQLIQNYVQALQQGDVDKMNAQLDENAVIIGLGGSLDSLNITQHNDYYTESTSLVTHTITEDLYLPIKVDNNWNEGEWVLSWGTNTIANKETSKAFEVPYHIASRVENGKVNYMRYYYDMLNVIRNQGFTISPPEAEE